jgi:hypothetical protein
MIEGPLVRTRAFDVITRDELIAHARSIVEDPAIVRPLRELWNALAVESFELFGHDVREVVQMADKFTSAFAGARLAIVTQDPVIHGMTRMAQAMAESLSLQIRLYGDLAAAEAWLRADEAGLSQGGP